MINILSGFVLAGSLLSVATQASTIVQIEPQTLVMYLGEKAQFSIGITNAENFYGFELQISYDPTKVQVVDGDPSKAGIQLIPGDMYEVGQGFLVASEADNEAGKAQFVFTLLAPAPPLVGDGTLVTVEFEAIDVGTSSIDLGQVIIASPDGEALPFTAIGGQVIIESVPEVTPSLSVTPIEQSTLIATIPLSTTETLEGFSSASPLPTMLQTSSTLIPDQKTPPPPLGTIADSQVSSQVNQSFKTFGLVVLAIAILMMLGGAWFFIRWRRKRG